MSYEDEGKMLLDQHMAEYNRITAEADKEGQGGLDGSSGAKIKELHRKYYNDIKALKQKYGIE